MNTEPTLRMAMLAFSALCVVWGVLRGVGRLVVLAVSAFAGAAAGWAFFRYAPDPLITWLNQFHAGAVRWGAVACGILGFWFCLRFVGALLNGRAMVPSGTAQRTRAGIFSLAPVLLILWGAAMAARWTGAVSLMHWVEELAISTNPASIPEPPLTARLRHGLSTGMLGQIIDRVDPLHSRESAALGALLALRRNDEAWNHLVRQPRMAPLVETGILRRLLRDHDVLHALSFSHYSKLLTLPELSEAVSSPDVRDALRGLSLEDAIISAIRGGQPLPTAPRAVIVE